MPAPGNSWRGDVGKAFLFAYLLIPTFSLTLYYIRRAKHPIKRSGRPKVAFVLMYISMCVALPIPLVEAYGWATTSCLVYNFAVMLFPPLFITPVLVSQVQHYRSARIHNKMAEHAANSNKSERKSERGSTHFLHLVASLKSERRHLRRNVLLLYLAILLVYGITITVFVVTNPITKHTLYQETSEYGQECKSSLVIFYINVVYAVTSLIVIALLVRSANNENLQDEYGVNKEYKMLIVVAVALIPPYAALQTIPDPELHIDSFDPNLIFILTMIILFSILVLWPAVRTFRTRNLHSSLSRLSVEHTDLNDVLTSNLYFLFVEHLKGEFSVENCLFWKEVEQLKADYLPNSASNDTTFGGTKRSRSSSLTSSGHIRKSSSSFSTQPYSLSDKFPVDVCKDIVDMFIKDGAAMEINISSSVKRQILIDLQYEEGKERATADGVALGGDMEAVSNKIFDEAQAQVFRLMETDSLPRFKTGKLFKQYVEAMADRSEEFSRDMQVPEKKPETQHNRNEHGIELAVRSNRGSAKALNRTHGGSKSPNGNKSPNGGRGISTRSLGSSNGSVSSAKSSSSTCSPSAELIANAI